MKDQTNLSLSLFDYKKNREIKMNLLEIKINNQNTRIRI